MQRLKFVGRPPIKIAESVKDVVHLKNEYARAIMDRGETLTDELANAVLAQSLFSWEERNPRPALDAEGNFQCTDLDLFSFLMPLADRHAVIEIPHYRNRRKVVVRANERKIGTNQFGPIRGLTSHKDVLSFSTLLRDNTIVQTDPETEKEETGAWRNYMIVDCDGHWYDGWDKIVFSPTARENDFILKHGLLTGNTVYFQYPVHPNRWQSVFGAPYLLLKMLIARIEDEARFYRQEVARLSYRIETKLHQEPTYEGATEPIKVPTIEMILDLPDFVGSYTRVQHSQPGAVQAYQRQKYLTYSLKRQVQFAVRADELAYFSFGKNKIAHWMEGRTWNHNWRPPRGKVDWNQMVLSPDCAFRYRVKTLTQQVSAE